jgi:hypothetical protein
MTFPRSRGPGFPESRLQFVTGSVRISSASGSAPSATSSSGSDGSSSHTGLIIGAVVAGIAAVGVVGAIFGVCLAWPRRSAAVAGSGQTYPASGGGLGGFVGCEMRSSDSSAFVPFRQSSQSDADSMHSPYRQFEPWASSQFAPSAEFDPYQDAYLPRSPSLT